jgi:general secretion pathway protein H
MMTVRRVPVQPDDDGFTLLELVIVLAMVAGIAALTLPNLWRKPVDLALRTTALDMAAMMRATRAEAVRRNNERAFLVNPAQRTYWSDASPAPRPIPASLGIDAQFSAPERTLAGSGRYAFFADGTASGGRIVLREGAASATIAIDGLTGNAEVRWAR